MGQNTDQDRLLRENLLELVSVGPVGDLWHGEYLKCPICGYLVSKGNGYDECLCGNIDIDADYFRVSIRDSQHSEIECYDAVPKKPKAKRK